MKPLRFQSILICLLFIGAGLAISGRVNAAACNYGPFNGECRDACQADEMDVAPPNASKNYQFSTCSGICCIKKGDALCNLVAKEEKVETKQGATWACSPQCTGTPLTTMAGGYGETCAGANICCSVGTDAKDAKKPAPTGKPTGSPITLVNKLGAGATIFTVMQRVISMFLGVVGALALGVFVYAGVLWMTAGSSDRVQKAKDALKYAVIGLFMIAFAYSISAFFFSTLAGGGAPKKAAVPEFAAPPEINP